MLRPPYRILDRNIPSWLFRTDWTSSRKHALVSMVVVCGMGPPETKASPRGLRGSEWWECKCRRSENHGAPVMATKTIEKSTKLERQPLAPPVSGKSTKSTHAQAANSTKARNHEAHPDQKSGQAPMTKHAQILQLLSRSEGASIEDLMQVTKWQQHSVRGFLAGTVKKKMGLVLTSSRVEGEPRRYKISARRGR